MYNMQFSHLLTDLLGKIRQHLGYFDLLGAYLFAGTALQAGGRLLFRREGAQRHGRDEPAAGIGVCVPIIFTTSFSRSDRYSANTF